MDVSADVRREVFGCDSGGPPLQALEDILGIIKFIQKHRKMVAR